MQQSYSFHQLYRPSDDLRVDQIVSFVDAFLPTLGMPELVDDDGYPVAPCSPSIRSLLDRWRNGRDASNKGVFDHATFMTVCKTKDEVSRFQCVVWTSPTSYPVVDSFRVLFGEKASLPSADVMKQAASIGRPFEACLHEFNNDADHRDRINRCKKEGFVRPAIIRGFHFLGKEFVDNLGGMDKCLKTPAFEVSPFQDGVLIRLVDNYFNARDPTHIEAQRTAMQHLGL